jgi:thiol-disulfide isomerase/thioredoxin
MAASVILPAINITRAVDPAPAAAAGREAKDILKDLAATSRELDKVMDSPKDLLDEDTRKDVAPKVAPPLRKMVALMKELEAAKPEMKDEIQGQRYMMTSLLIVAGDADATKSLDETIKGADKDAALAATLSKALGQYWLSGEETEQVKQIAAVTALGADAKSKKTARETLNLMANLGASNMDVKYKAIAAIDSFVDGVGKPVEFEGQTVGGKSFSTREYAGKVVLIDFWATWCGPCKAELPHVKEIYKKYHEKGLEIVGVSCDSSGDTLVAFTEKEGMPWVQLWDKDKQSKPENQWHELAKQWKVEGIPTMFLIDRNGILRTTEARGSLDDMIPKLLAEKVKDAKAADPK